MKQLSVIDGMSMRRRDAAKQNYQISELKRLTSNGLSLSKSAKLLGIKYQLAATLMTL